MLRIQIENVNHFMNDLLTGDSFDSFYLVSATIKMGISYHFDGRLNKEFYDSDTRAMITRDYCLYKELRPSLYNILKGKPKPLSIRIVLMLPASYLKNILSESCPTFPMDAVSAAYINISYDPEKLIVTTGISYSDFIMDKTAEQLFDQFVNDLLLK